ncbi:MAG: DddA-like double-stranded DNA deaminase toxin [Pseudonocardiales bacterium]
MPALPGFLPPQPPVDPVIIEQVRRSLLPPGRYGSTATGWLFEADGGRVRIRSGVPDAEGWHDTALDYIDTHLADEGAGLRWLARHVEVKAARMLAEQPPRHAILVLDRQVCGRDDVARDYPYTCDEYLSVMIPRGSSLTVVEFDGTHVTYEGTGTR